MTSQTLDCDQIEAALQTLGADINASELHGTLCALLCADDDLQADNWYQTLIPDSSARDLLLAEARQLLEELYRETRQHLNDPNFDYQLLLPSDSNSIDTRTTALSDWCQGFIMGLMMSGYKDFHKLPENSAEVSQDIVEISRADNSFPSENLDEDEAALEELIEYVRVGVLLINEEMHPERKPPQLPNGQKLH
jgi:yecA family protein